MEAYYQLLAQMDLFDGIELEKLPSLLNCLSDGTSSYEKGEQLSFGRNPLDRFGIVLEGQVQIVQDDYFGNRSIMANIDVGELFGESFAFSGVKMQSVDVYAAQKTKVLFIHVKKFQLPCSTVCDFHSKLIANMLAISSRKNVMLTEKISLMSKRTTREKVLAYFSMMVKKKGTSQFEIPFNRQELADYLCVDRSALSAELSKLKKEGILDFQKNQFHLF